MPNPPQQSDTVGIYNGAIINIASLAFPNVFLRMDGSGVTQHSASGGGVVNCQFGAGAWERFRIEIQPDNLPAIASVHFPNVYLRMDCGGITQPDTGGSGVVNCQFGVGLLEKCDVEIQSDGTVAIRSIKFGGRYLRMDGTGVTQPTGSGGGIVNCQNGPGPWEIFRLVLA